MRKILIIILSILLLSTATLAGYFFLSGNEKTYLISQVIDGDTVQLENGERIRLLGIDAPEQNECYYQQSKDRLKELVEGKEVKLESGPDDKDRYGRLLRYIFIDTISVDLQLVKEGYAIVYMIQPDEEYYIELKEAENEARDKLLGIWNNASFSNCIFMVN